MGIYWLTSAFILISVIMGGIHYRSDPFAHINNEDTVARALSDNLQTYAAASMYYIMNQKLDNVTEIDEGLITPYLPLKSKSLIKYKIIFTIDQIKHQWLIVSYDDVNYNGLKDQSLGEDILRALTQRVNNKIINRKSNYQSVIVGINNNCNLNSNIQSLTNLVQQSFNYVCNNNSSAFLKYTLMVSVNQ